MLLCLSNKDSCCLRNALSSNSHGVHLEVALNIPHRILMNRLLMNHIWSFNTGTFFISLHILRQLILHRQIKRVILTSFSLISNWNSSIWLGFEVATLILMHLLQFLLHFQNLLALLLLVIFNISGNYLFSDIGKRTGLNLVILLIWIWHQKLA